MRPFRCSYSEIASMEEKKKAAEMQSRNYEMEVSDADIIDKERKF